MRRLETIKRFAGLIAVLVLAAGITAASALTESRMGQRRVRAGLELHVHEVVRIELPAQVGVVGGDIDGQFGGDQSSAPRLTKPAASSGRPSTSSLRRSPSRSPPSVSTASTSRGTAVLGRPASSMGTCPTRAHVSNSRVRL